MAEVNGNFDFKKYDVGGSEATANDGKLTGEEARNARADGWTIWDGFSEENEAPKNVNEGVNGNDNGDSAQGGSLADKIGKLQLPQWAKDLIKPIGISAPSGEDNAQKLSKISTPIIDELIAKNRPTEEQRQARAELGKKSANGMTYDEAYDTWKSIQSKYSRPLNDNGGTYFAPNELPPDVKAEYKQVVLAMKEILDNNQELAEKANIMYVGIAGSEWGYTIIADPVRDYDNKDVDKSDKSDNSTPAPKLSELKQDTIDALIRKWDSPKVDGKPIDDVIADLTGKNDDKLTAEQKEARAEMNQKQSSIGMTYADAKAKVAEILQKYPNCYDEVEVPKDFQSDENGNVLMIYREDRKTKVFNPDNLPEPAKTEYREARASMREIENANSELAQKGGIKVTPIKSQTTRHSMYDDFDSIAYEIGFKLPSKSEPTETQKSARAKLNEKVSSTGMSYKDAKATIESITKQYKDNPDYQSEFGQDQPTRIHSYYPTVRAFDPYKLKGADREVFFNALSAIHEIETANYALLTQAGLKLTEDPEMPQSEEKLFVDN